MRPLGHGAAPVIGVRVDTFTRDQLVFLARLNGQKLSPFVRSALDAYFEDLHDADHPECPSRAGHELVTDDPSPVRGEWSRCVNDLGTGGRSICGYGFVWDESGALAEFNRTYDEKN